MADRRDSAADIRDQKADIRDRQADRRDRHADQRDRQAFQREQLTDRHGAAADDREILALRRQHGRRTAPVEPTSPGPDETPPS